MKQETTSEAFYRISKELNYSEFDFLSFKIGIEWQQKIQDYSEEDLREAFNKGFKLGFNGYTTLNLEDSEFNDWLEQIKNK